MTISHSPKRVRMNRKSNLLTAVMILFVIYSVLPLVYLLVNSTKSQGDLLSTFGLGFGGSFELFDNLAKVFSYDNGIFLTWFGNTLLYVVVGAGGATFIATIAGYGIAKFDFTGKKAVFAIVLGSIAIP